MFQKMGIIFKIAYYTQFLLILIPVVVNGRFLDHSTSELVSDGGDDLAQGAESSFLHLKGIDSSEEQCEQMYGFLPCSENTLGHFFLIVVYEYLLYHGECYVSSGGKRIFKILGPGIFGASAFQILGFLPESLILLFSGLFNTQEVAQEYVLTGVGLLAGSTILLLTLLWGTCVIIGSKDFSSESGSNTSSRSTQSPYKKFLSFLTGSGVTTDPETSSAARIMLLSLIPFLFLLIPKLFGMTYTTHGYIYIITLPVSVTFLLVYFIYQVFEPSIQKRRLSYVKHEHLVLDLLKHIQEHTTEKILTEDGLANLPAIKSLFTKIDQDGDAYISFPELRGVLQDIKFRQLTWDKQQTIEQVMKEFDDDGDTKVTIDEFTDRFTKWLDETKSAVNKPYRSVGSWKDLYQVVQPWVQTKKKEHEMMKALVSEIISHTKNSPLGNFYTEDGKPNVSAIKRLFKSLDVNNDNSISLSELKTLMMDFDFGETSWNVDEATSHIMQDLDKSGDQQIDEEEFVDGFRDLLNVSNVQLTPKTPGPKDISRKPWEKWVDGEVDRSMWAWTKAVMLLVLGITMLALLAEPLIHSVQNVSNSATIPSFFISFILVPLATNARAAVTAIQTASQRKERTTSLTFSEIYDGVFMNNVLGFSVLLAVVYFRGLVWHFTAELLVVFIVCIVVGTAAGFRSKFPVWTSIASYLLYPLSLIFVYVFADFQ
ncbi:putative sodium/calcium exchanger membrane region, EF-hand domain pair, mitochondrial Rho GTPase [Helianthus annuus]|uniref:Putative sodium/calcium exchanger membrane region, EF-hand domain pair n=1 Tax=Helianthus annuus TaxID=4232 RepID=A0A251RNR3_HELAN|nr:sodium/calcium exchanger NCL2 [Helianthus annuus]KAF5780862.1 putative sodium/calcium exchanger membrane region, EF-hand domain pair, mitochondrial Rho GTPase [Helianthus annuus]KAJ0508133.1 putative EF-hand domain pair protein CML [Helianthus annuus]KAJ0516444.1 putative EF-hand domain, sodium/calcium exchanger membrane region, EF-hand domain pair [Helianthus annuus]KAJ0684446.1 putative EF-hand domain, sodium/calcium exchanger membrane region, EF-hand domain pair [Helianthus annuus]KAJ087